jgi:hypothetical protein
MANGKIELRLPNEGSDVAYLSLQAHPGQGKPGVAAKQVRLRDLFPDYDGPDVFFDFSASNQLIGIEVVG